MIKVLIVDDSAVVRNMYKSMMETDPEIAVIGTASDPYIAVQKIQRERPDVITLDIEMPRMDGLTFLKKLMSQAPMPVVVISNQTTKGAEVALKALEMGAVDVMAKPTMPTEVEMQEARINLIDKVRSAYSAVSGRERKKSVGSSPASIQAKTPVEKVVGSHSIHLIAVGASTGGTEAIRTFLERLPLSMPPIVIVQHMPEKFTTSFAKRLDECCALRVKEGED